MNSPRASAAARLRRFVGASLLATVLAAVLPSCEHKDLCLDHSSHALRYSTDLRLDYNFAWEIPHEGLTDWQSTWDAAKMGTPYDALRPHLPEGVRVAMYADDSPRLIDNIDAEGGHLGLRPGKNSLILYNNDTEYIEFDDMENYASAKATTRSRTRASYAGSPFSRPGDESENTVAPPDMLFGSYVDEYIQEMITIAPRLDITMHPLVFTYVIRYEFEHGAKYLGLARGALAGMAASVSLSSGRTSREKATILFDAEVKPWGVEAIVKSFGIPDFPNGDYSRGNNVYSLNLEVRLRNGNIVMFDRDVTDQIVRQPHGGVIVVNGLTVSDEDGNEGGGGFDVSVEGWGEWEDVDIIF